MKIKELIFAKKQRMIQKLKTIYALIKDNQIIVIDSNLKNFLEQLPEDIKDLRAYSYYYRLFQEHNFVKFSLKDGYFLQKIEF